MHNALADRNLLFGILAVQLDFISGDQLIAAMNTWVLEKSRPLEDHLLDSGDLTTDTHALLKALVDKHIQQHGGSTRQSLAAVRSAVSVRTNLGQINDTDVEKSLLHVAPAIGQDDLLATRLPEPTHADPGLRFNVIRPHASGGLGKVSVAHDAELHREVALKELLDRHADDLNSRARFLQEAEITGGLEHPGVVPIYGLGQYADGRPFYAMRFIRGDSLKEGIEQFHASAGKDWKHPEHGLQLRRLLGRLIDVCNAVEYAHSRGVLHRDLKPGNIMLGQYGETLVVDWGLAKAVGRTELYYHSQSGDSSAPLSTEETLQPASGSGSAPTQIGSAIGTPAYMSPEQAAGQLGKLGPASDVFSLGATLYALLTGNPPQQDSDVGIVLQRVQRGTFPKPRKVNPAIPRALEAICLKAMARDQSDRYSSPRQLADDLEHWLADDPVVAFTEPWTTKAGRWVKGHRTIVGSGMAGILVALVSLLTGVVLLSASNKRERGAKEEAVVAKDAALAAQAESQRHNQRAEQLLDLARRSLEHYEKLSKSEELLRFGMEGLRSDLLENAMLYYETLAKQEAQTLQEREDQGNAYYRLGETYRQMGHIEQAIDAHRQSLDILDNIIQEQPEDVDILENSAMVRMALGEILTANQKATEAREVLAQAQSRFQSLAQQHPEVPRYQEMRAATLLDEGERLRRTGAMDQATTTISQANNILRRLVDQSPDNQDYRYRLADGLLRLGALQAGATWQFNAAKSALDEAHEIASQLFTEMPDAANVAYNLVRIKRNSANWYTRQFIVGDAKAMYEEAIEILGKLESIYPDASYYRREMADLQHSLASLLTGSFGPAESEQATKLLQSAVEICRRLVELYPEQTEFRLNLAQYLGSYGAMLHEQGETDLAMEQMNDSIRQLAELSAKSTGVIDEMIAQASMEYSMANQMLVMDRAEQAFQLFEQSEKHYKRIVEHAPQVGNARLSLAQICVDRASWFAENYRTMDAIKELNGAISISENLQGVSDTATMQVGLTAVAALAKTLRWTYVSSIRNGDLEQVVESGFYREAVDDALQFAQSTKDPADHYMAARVLSLSSAKVFDGTELTEGERNQFAEQYARQATKQLSVAWKGGYIRRTGGFAALLKSSPTLRTLQNDDAFEPLRKHDDFQQLLKQIGLRKE